MNNRGFSLLEVLIASAILATAMITLSVAWSGNLTRVRKAKLNNNAAFLLERKMAETLLKYQGDRARLLPEEDSGDFGSEYPNYKWIIESRAFEMPDLKSAFIAGQNESTTSELVLTVIGQMQEFFSKSITEVRVTIVVQLPNKSEKKYSATSYIVDYDQQLSLPGGA